MVGIGRRLRGAALALALLGAGVGAGGDAKAVDVDLTPSGVVAVWLKINDAVLTIAEIDGLDGATMDQLRSMTVIPVEGKKPAQVLERVADFRETIQAMRKLHGLPDVATYAERDGRVDPAVVFLNSGYVLNGVVDVIIDITDAEFLVSGYYDFERLEGKKPDDAYAMADLAVRRLELLLARL